VKVVSCDDVISKASQASSMSESISIFCRVYYSHLAVQNNTQFPVVVAIMHRTMRFSSLFFMDIRDVSVAPKKMARSTNSNTYLPPGKMLDMNSGRDQSHATGVNGDPSRLTSLPSGERLLCAEKKDHKLNMNSDGREPLRLLMTK
jgi:hypothetical protein